MREQTSDIRRWHYIAGNKRTSVPSNMLFFDTETTSVPIEGNANATIQVLRLWTAISGRLIKGKLSRVKKHAGTTAAEFWNLVDSLANERKPLWCFAHNVGFDLTTLLFWRELELDHYTLEHGQLSVGTVGKQFVIKPWRGFAVLEDPPVIVECRLTGTASNIVFVDTYNYFRTSLAKIGESVALPKITMPEATDPDGTWAHYCHRDSEIIMRAIVGFCRFVLDNDLGMFRYTAPAQAFSAYRHRFMPQKILVHGNEDALKLEREAYYGGRCEPFFVGTVQNKDVDTLQYYGRKVSVFKNYRNGPVYVLDFQSCYPSVMRANLYPYRISQYVISPSPAEVRLALMSNLVIARVRIDSLIETFPVRHDGRVIMAGGKFTTTLCGPELLRAFKTDSIRSIGAAAIYHGADIFTDYVDYFWLMRQEYQSSGRKVYAELCKVMLNSLAGKFGQRSHRWEPDPTTFAPFPWGQWAAREVNSSKSDRYRSLAWTVEKQAELGESHDSCPAISAYVTSYARELLESARQIAGPQNVYYVDTDSIHCNGIGVVNLDAAGMVSDNTLGKLRKIGVYETAEYRGIKDYTVGDSHVISGVKVSAEQLSKGIFRQPQFQKLASILSGSPPRGVRVDMVTIDRSVGLRTGHILTDGTVEPITLGEGG